MTFVWWHLVLFIAPVLPSLWSIWHICGHEFDSPQSKSLWLAFVVFVPVLGGLAYILAGRRHAGRRSGI